jgi:Uma2 family endonuclease
MAMPALVPTYTVADLEAFPRDGNRYELLDGHLLVTPQAEFGHQVVATRIATALHAFLGAGEQGRVVAPGAVEILPKTHLEPDILVVPARFPLASKWSEIRDWWLAVEVFSPSSVIYDRDFKRNAYLALGVAEVWLVNLEEQAVFVSRRGGPTDLRCRDRLVWMPPEMTEPLELDLRSVFAGL